MFWRYIYTVLLLSKVKVCEWFLNMPSSLYFLAPGVGLRTISIQILRFFIAIDLY